MAYGSLRGTQCKWVIKCFAFKAICKHDKFDCKLTEARKKRLAITFSYSLKRCMFDTKETHKNRTLSISHSISAQVHLKGVALLS